MNEQTRGRKGGVTDIGEEADAADAALEQPLEPPRDVVEDLHLALGQRLALVHREWSGGVGQVLLHHWQALCK